MQVKTATSQPKLNFDNSGYYAIVLLALVVAGFWPSYFRQFFDGKGSFRFYIHLHASLMLIWIGMLIVQPILVRKKKIYWHRVIGKSSYLLFPFICLTSLFTIRLTHHPGEADPGIGLLAQSKNLILFVMAYCIAIAARHNFAVHARAMASTGIAIIEPALARLFYNTLSGYKVLNSLPAFGNVFAMVLVYLLLTALMIKERRQKNGRWVFPLVLMIYFVLNTIVLFNIHVGIWEMFARWFIRL